MVPSRMPEMELARKAVPGQLLWQAARRREVESLAVPKKPVLLRKQAEMLRVDLPAARPNLGSCVPEAKRSLRRMTGAPAAIVRNPTIRMCCSDVTLRMTLPPLKKLKVRWVR